MAVVGGRGEGGLCWDEPPVPFSCVEHSSREASAKSLSAVFTFLELARASLVSFFLSFALRALAACRCRGTGFMCPSKRDEKVTALRFELRVACKGRGLSEELLIILELLGTVEWDDEGALVAAGWLTEAALPMFAVC